jgi:hypothetical protein
MIAVRLKPINNIVWEIYRPRIRRGAVSSLLLSVFERPYFVSTVNDDATAGLSLPFAFVDSPTNNCNTDVSVSF